MNNEVLRQLAAARVISQGKVSVSTRSPFLTDEIEDDTDREYDEQLTVAGLLEDLTINPDQCAFPSSSQQRCLSNKQVYQLINNHTELMKVSRNIEQQLFKPNEHMCTSIDLNRHYEVYFESSDRSSPNLLTLDHLQSLCKKQSELVDLFQLHSTCHYTLPQIVAYFSNKSDCQQLVKSDIEHFIASIQRCHALYDAGLIRLAGLHRYRMKPLELFQYDTCFRYNFTFLTLEYLLDKTFLETNETRYTAMWFLKPEKPIRTANGSEVHTSETAYDLFIEHFYENPQFDHGSTQISALNFLDIRIPTAMKQIRVDMFFVILAISLIVGVSCFASLRSPFVCFLHSFR